MSSQYLWGLILFIKHKISFDELKLTRINLIDPINIKQIFMLFQLLFNTISFWFKLEDSFHWPNIYFKLIFFVFHWVLYADPWVVEYNEAFIVLISTLVVFEKLSYLELWSFIEVIIDNGQLFSLIVSIFHFLDAFDI